MKSLIAVGALTVASLLAIVFGVHISPDVSALLPSEQDGGALSRYARVFGGSDPALVLVEGGDPEIVQRAAEEAAAELVREPQVEQALSALSLPDLGRPSLLFRTAGPHATARLQQALTPEGMRKRLQETRALLLAPGSAALGPLLARDPLRLGQIVAEEGAALLGGVHRRKDGDLATAEGTARLVLVKPRGSALRGEDARSFTDHASAALDRVRARFPGVTLGLTGGHAIAAATEQMLRRDLALSATLAIAFVALVFAITFGRLRALLAVFPPLLLGTLWTAAVALFFRQGLSAIALGFAAVVVGVGVDTGVHVYDQLLVARREGLAPMNAAHRARQRTARPVLIAALCAAAAFSSLALSQIAAVRQLGILCAAGEVLTAVAILLLVPTLGARLESGSPPRARPFLLTRLLMVRSRRRGAVVLTALSLACLGVGIAHPPALGRAVVAIRPQHLAPMRVQERIFQLFGGKPGQLVVLLRDIDRERLLQRGDHLVDALAPAHPLIEDFDTLSVLVPSEATQRARFTARDAQLSPSCAVELERALTLAGFRREPFAEALADLRAPSAELVHPEDYATSPLSGIVSRHLGRDGDEWVLAAYVRPREGKEGDLRDLVMAADGGAEITGYAHLEQLLRSSLLHDLPRAGALAAALVVASLAASLRRSREVLLAAWVLALEMAALLGIAGFLGVTLHVYDALVLPALLGITLDEVMFLLEATRRMGVRRALEEEGGAIVATALTTSAGFFALLACQYEPLRDLGILGGLGSLLGLVVSLVVVSFASPDAQLGGASHSQGSAESIRAPDE